MSAKTRFRIRTRYLLWLLFSAGFLILPLPLAASLPLFPAAVSLIAFVLVFLAFRLPPLLVSAKKAADGARFSRFSLLFVLLFDLAYAAFRLLLGVRTRSLWFCAEAVYYAVQAAFRTGLAEDERAARGKEEPAGAALLAWQTYRQGGEILFFLSTVMGGIVILVLREERTHPYPNAVVIAAVLWAATRAFLTLFSLLRLGKKGHTVLSFSKLLSFDTTLLSLFSLQVTLLSRFGAGVRHRQTLNLLCGGAVVFLSLLLSVTSRIRGASMVRRISGKCAETKKESHSGDPFN